MGSILHCLFQFCCDGEDENDQDSVASPTEHDDGGYVTSPALTCMSRTTRSSTSDQQQHHSYHRIVPNEDVARGSAEPRVAALSDPHESSAHARRPEDCGLDVGEGHPAMMEDHYAVGIHTFFRRLRERLRMQDDTTESITEASEQSPFMTRKPSVSKGDTLTDSPTGKKLPPPPPSPLRQASTFDSSHEIPSISSEEVVLPGSELQKEMARIMSMDASIVNHDDECVICMEGFEPTNPRMPTICGCGENKTYFHLPCLYQWMEQCQECPSCREPLRWQEF